MSNDKLAQALREYFYASEAFQLTLGHPEATAQDEHAAEQRHAKATREAREAITAHEAEKQAGPVAIQASAPAPGARHRLLTMLPEARTALAALELIACNQTSKAHEEQFTLLREYLLSQQPPAQDTAPPSPLTEQDKEDAELTDDEILACRRFAGAGPDTRLDRIAFGRAVLRAAREKKDTQK